jgi:hypothetical protein
LTGDLPTDYRLDDGTIVDLNGPGWHHESYKIIPKMGYWGFVYKPPGDELNPAKWVYVYREGDTPSGLTDFWDDTSTVGRIFQGLATFFISLMAAPGTIALNLANVFMKEKDPFMRRPLQWRATATPGLESHRKLNFEKTDYASLPAQLGWPSKYLELSDGLVQPILNSRVVTFRNGGGAFS